MVMPQIKNILFPVDFSDRTCSASSFVVSFMKRFSAKATLLHVVEPVPYAAYAVETPMVVDLEALQSDAQEYLERSLIREFEGLPVKRVVEVGEAAEVITRFAESDNSDLIMMPTHGYGPFRRFLLGSVASKVLHDARCPVWTAAHAEEPPLKQHVSCRSVLCAVDGSDNSLSVLQWASEFAKDAEATLRLVHVIPGPGEWLGRTVDVDFEGELRKQARTMIEKLANSAGIDAPICIGVGDIGPTIKKEAVGHGADLVIIGRGTLHEKLGRLRAHSYQIVRTAPCPVISV
jgi:nucleotide-binding universal stress UspA family protein